MAERTVRCVTCHQPLPPDHPHPPVIGHKGPLGNERLDLIDSLTPLFCFLDAMQEAIGQLTEMAEAEQTIQPLARLGQELTGEIQRRTHWLYELSKPPQAEQTG